MVFDEGWLLSAVGGIRKAAEREAAAVSSNCPPHASHQSCGKQRRVIFRLALAVLREEPGWLFQFVTCVLAFKGLICGCEWSRGFGERSGYVGARLVDENQTDPQWARV